MKAKPIIKEQYKKLEDQEEVIKKDIQWYQDLIYDFEQFKKKVQINQEEILQSFQGSQYQEQICSSSMDLEDSLIQVKKELRDKEEELYKQKQTIQQELVNLENQKKEEEK